MGRRVELEELVEHWTLLGDEQDLVAGKRGPTRLAFALLLKHYTRWGRFPAGPAEFPGDVVDFVARQVDVPAGEFGSYRWTGRTINYHRAQIREALGYRQCSVGDADKLVVWLVDNVAQVERRPVQVREELLARCRADRVEPPTEGQIDRMVRSALHQAEEALCVRVTSRFGAGVAERIEALVDVDPATAEADGPEGMTKLAFIRSEPGKVSLESMLTEIDKLLAVRAVGLPSDLFADVAPRVVAGWHARASVESPSHLATHPRLLRLTLLAALLHTREHQLTDTLVDLLIRTVHNIGARAERRVTQELVNAFRRVTGKENILFSIAEAALDAPDEPVRDVVYPAANGGEQTLRDLVHEYKTKGPEYRHTVRTTLRASYTGHYRRGLIRLLEVLEFRSNNTAHQPVIEALSLIGRYASAGNLSYYPLGEAVPIHRGIAGDWAEIVYRTDGRRQQRVVRMVYEICTFQALRDQLRCKEIWVVGADQWRNPDQDLPVDFDQRRHEHYAALRKPLDPTVFIDELREDMRRELAELNDAVPLPWLEISDRRAGAIKLTPLDAAPEPRNLRQLKREVQARWGDVALIDMLKEAALRTGCLDAVATAATRRDLDTGTLLERLILAIYAYGTNTGIRAVAAGDHGHSTEDVRYVRRRYLSTDTARAIAVALADATFAARHTSIWGTSSTAVASDSTHVGAFDQNIFTEWHARCGGRGVLIYWHVEEQSVVVHSQLISCTASEVAAMIEGAVATAPR